MKTKVLKSVLIETLSVLEAARLLGVHPNTIYNMIHDGRLFAVKKGRAWRIPRENVLCLSE